MIKNILIVGGGIAGMTSALALSRRGVAVTLIDRDPEWRVYGAGISITGMSMRAFHDLGILPEVRARGYVGRGLRRRTAAGEEIIVPGAPPAPSDAPPIMLNGGIMRPVLHDILSHSVLDAGIDVRLGVAVERFTQDEAGVEVSFTNGEVERYDLMVGADGIFSETRTAIFPDAPKPCFTGQGCWRIVARRPEVVDRTEIYFGGEVKLGMAPISSTHMYCFILEHLPDNPFLDPEEMLPHVDRLLAEFGGSAPKVRSELGPESQVNYRPLEWLLLPDRWHNGRVVLIGDAVHATTPHMASGAGLAVEDGLVLADELAKTDDVAAALNAFTIRRKDRARLVVETSVRMGELEMADKNSVEGNLMLMSASKALAAPY